MNFKKLLVSLLLLTSCLALFAVQTMTVRWQWELNDPDVKEYRYQLDGTKDDAWTVVSGKTDTYEATNLDPYENHTLYLQSSYNGVDWSETASSTAKALLERKPEPVIEEEPVVEVKAAEEPVVEAEPVVAQKEEVKKEPKAKKEKVEKPKKERYNYPFSFNLITSAGVATNVYNIPIQDFRLEGIFTRYNLGLEFQNIVHVSHWGMGLRLDTNILIEPYEQTWESVKGISAKQFFAPDQWWYDSTFDLMLMMYFGTTNFDFYFGGGGGYSLFNPPLASPYDVAYGHSAGTVGKKFSSAWVIPATLGFRFSCAKHFMLGAELNMRYLLPAMKLSASADLVFTVDF